MSIKELIESLNKGENHYWYITTTDERIRIIKSIKDAFDENRVKVISAFHEWDESESKFRNGDIIIIKNTNVFIKKAGNGKFFVSYLNKGLTFFFCLKHDINNYAWKNFFWKTKSIYKFEPDPQIETGKPERKLIKNINLHKISEWISIIIIMIVIAVFSIVSFIISKPTTIWICIHIILSIIAFIVTVSTLKNKLAQFIFRIISARCIFE